MKSIITICTMLIFIFLILPIYANAEINFSSGQWSTTFNYGPCSQSGGGGLVTCGSYSPDGIFIGAGGANNLEGNYTQVVNIANNGLGNGNGLRMWIGDGQNNQSGLVRIELPTYQKELWIRWYSRYQAGFNWSTLGYTKELYLTTDGPGISVIPGFHYSDFVLIAQGTPDYYQVESNFGWNSLMGGSTSDGLFHCFEIHIKMDTNGSDGIGELWVDGDLKVSKTGVNWSNNNATAKKGWTFFDLHTNQNTPANGRSMYLDIDDIEVYNSLPPGRDEGGKAYIGPINEMVGDNVAPLAPSGLSVL